MKDKKVLIISSVMVFLALLIAVVAVFWAQNQPVTLAKNITPLPKNTLAAAEYQNYYPLQYDSYLLNNKVDTKESYKATGGEFGGAFYKESHFIPQPYLPVLFNGMGFSVEYNEDRGHLYTLEDVKAITTQRTKAGASCLYCKSAEVPSLIAEYGDAFYTSSFDEMVAKMNDAITCADCHDPETMKLTITRPALVEAYSRQGKDISQATNQEMRSLVCAQCHVEYYFAPGTKKVTFPWDKGEKAEAVYEYYQEIDFSDFNHGMTGGKMIKAQHPDFELFLNSTHAAAGLACADCHMPYMTAGTQKYTSHWWTSPLKHMDESCLTCHRESKEELTARVRYTQDRTWELQDIAGKTIEQAIREIDSANKVEGHNEEILAEAKALHRQAQFYWDWIAAENSRGFHNPQDAMNTLGKAIDLAHQASAKAKAAY